MQKICIFPRICRTVLAKSQCKILVNNVVAFEKPLGWRIIQQRTFSGQKNQHREKSTAHITPWQWILLVIPATSFGLGCWQVQRKKWKEDLIANLQVKTTQNPAELPDNLDDLTDLEYRPVIIRGTFLHEKELYMGPRSFIQHGDAQSKSGVFSKQGNTVGYNVITPLKLEGREEIILVNRGWVPRNRLNPATRSAGQIPNTVQLIGIVRLNENRPQFSPESKGDHFLYRDLGRMCSITGANPYFVDAVEASTVPEGPIGGQTRITVRNEHLSYIITWFSLSAATVFVWYRQILKRKPF
ncbi:SURF1-like protein [Sergentomyia squamirostris]